MIKIRSSESFGEPIELKHIITLLMITFAIGILVLTAGLFLKSRTIRNIIASFYVSFQSVAESAGIRKIAAIESAFRIVSAIYTKDGKVSARRILNVALFGNISLVMAPTILDSSVALFRNDFLSFIPIFALMIFWTFVFELTSVKISLYMFEIAARKGLLRYLALDVLLVLAITQIAPLSIIFIFWEPIRDVPGGTLLLTLDFYLYFAPVLTSAIAIAFSIEYSAYFLIFGIPVLGSVLIPTVMGYSFVRIFRSRRLFALLASSMDYISSTKSDQMISAGERIIALSASILAFVNLMELGK